jgi:hypothetical protein
LKNNGNGTFAGAVNYEVGRYPTPVFAADLDGDGKPDLAVANYYSTVSILKNNGNGTFAGAVNYGVGLTPLSVLAADLDGDGKPDLAVANYGSDNVSILKNIGNRSIVCCSGLTGNIDCDLSSIVDIGDLTVLVDHLFITFTPLCCESEASVDGAEGVDIGDLIVLVDHLFINFGPLVSCP